MPESMAQSAEYAFSQQKSANPSTVSPLGKDDWQHPSGDGARSGESRPVIL